MGECLETCAYRGEKLHFLRFQKAVKPLEFFQNSALREAREENPEEMTATLKSSVIELLFPEIRPEYEKRDSSVTRRLLKGKADLCDLHDFILRSPKRTLNCIET